MGEGKREGRGRAKGDALTFAEDFFTGEGMWTRGFSKPAGCDLSEAWHVPRSQKFVTEGPGK